MVGVCWPGSKKEAERGQVARSWVTHSLTGLELGIVRLRAPGRAAAVTFLLEHVADHKAHEAHEEEDQYKQEEHVQPMLGRLQVRLWFRHEALGGERGPGRCLELEGCS